MNSQPKPERSEAGRGQNRRNAVPRNVPAVGSAVTHWMRVRAAIAAAIFILLGFGTVIYNLYQLQIVQHVELATRAENQQLADEVITPNRGVIYDTDMKVLARSSRVWTVVASPRDMKNAKTDIRMVAETLAGMLELNAEDILAKLQKTDSNYQRLKRQVEKPVADAITAWITEYNATEQGKETPVTGISLVQDSKRYYPYQTLASTVLGFVNADGDGVLGLEHYYNEELKGVPGRTVGMKNAWGYDLPNGSYEASYDAEDGNGLVLTLNVNIQSSLEKYLRNAVEEYDVMNRAVGIVMDVNTGAIYAMTTIPDYNLQDPYTIADAELAAQIAAIADDEERANARYTAQWAQWRNKAVSDIYYPGSVFKTITASAALDSGAANLNTTYTCRGSINVAGIPMKCAHTEGQGTLDFFGGLDGSCNPYYVTLGQMMGARTFCDYLQAFGFYEKTGIDMDDEASTQYVPFERMGPVELASSSFGQTTCTTPIQMITAASAAINGGYLVQPHIVEKILDADGNLLQNVEPEVKRQVISAETSNTMRELLVKSVNLKDANGTPIGGNKTGIVAGYNAGGKSGTSQRKQNISTDEEQTYYSSYWGFAPGDDPQIAVLVMLDTPHDELRGNFYGGRLAAPVVKNVIDEALQELGVPKQYTEAELAKVETSVPKVVGETINVAAGKLRDAGFNVDTSRATGESVLYQYPAAGSVIPRQSTIILYSDDRTETGGDLVTVPQITDLGYDSVCATLKSRGLNIRELGVTGGGRHVVATAQSIPAATQVEMGTVIEVTFHDKTVLD